MFVPFSPPLSSLFFAALVQVAAVSPCSKATPLPQEFVKVKVVRGGSSCEEIHRFQRNANCWEATSGRRPEADPSASFGSAMSQPSDAASSALKSITGIAETKLRRNWWHACQRYGCAVPIQFHRCRDGVKDKLGVVGLHSLHM